MGKLDSSVTSVPWPILVHGHGLARWVNQAFVSRFGIDPAGMGVLRVRELLWCLGIQDPLAGMIASGAVFPELEVVSLGEAGSGRVCLRQLPLPGEDEHEGEAPLLMLVMADRQLGDPVLP